MTHASDRSFTDELVEAPLPGRLVARPCTSEIDAWESAWAAEEPSGFWAFVRDDERQVDSGAEPTWADDDEVDDEVTQPTLPSIGIDRVEPPGAPPAPPRGLRALAARLFGWGSAAAR